MISRKSLSYLTMGAAMFCSACAIPSRYENPDPAKVPVARMRYGTNIPDQMALSMYKESQNTCLKRTPDANLPSLGLFRAAPKVGMPVTDTEWRMRPIEVYLEAGTPFTGYAIYGTGTSPGWQYNCQPVFRFTPKAGRDYEAMFRLDILAVGRHVCKVEINELKRDASNALIREPVPTEQLLRTPNCKP